ncbi:MAG TPA: hypothetical protein VIF15_05140 [Polyangiaceae bacterium]|jgi:hypothetical protein
MAVGLAVLFVLFIGHTLVAVAGVLSALRARLWIALGSAAVAGLVFDVQALPPWPPRVSIAAIGGSFVACIVGIVSVRMAARRAPNADVERETAGHSSMLIGLASIDACVLVALALGGLFVGRD